MMRRLEANPAQRADLAFMAEALRLAREAEACGEVPVGAVVVLDGRIVGSASNRPLGTHDPTAHAEVLALREAASRCGNYRLTGAWLIASLEPCLMCLGAAIHARVARLVFGAHDPRLGASSLIAGLYQKPGALNHRIEIVGGVRSEQSAAMLRTFFSARRSPIVSEETGGVAGSFTIG